MRPCRLPDAATFRALTRLTLLSIDTVGDLGDDPELAGDEIEATIAALPQLQHLRCSGASESASMHVPCLPRALTRLHSLERFWWDFPAEDSSLPGPGSAWLHGLRELALLVETLELDANHDRLLAATPHLTSLHLLGNERWQLAVPWRFAGGHPALRRVHVDLSRSHDSVAGRTITAMELTAKHRPDVSFSPCDVCLFNQGAAFDGEPVDG